MIGLVGAQRVGKTTLARAFAKEQGLLFLETNVSGVFKSLGLDPAADYDLEHRLAIQVVILEELTRQYELAQKKHRIFVTDRTPIDMAGYMLADLQRTNCSPGMSVAILKYVQDCIDVANRFFGLLVLVQPGIPVIEAEGKAPGIPAYQEHLTALMFGLLMDERMSQRHAFIPRRVLAVEDRVRSLASAAMRALDTHSKIIEDRGVTIH